MRLFRSLFSYPLLARELTERAARRRTYAIRVIYGAILYTLFIMAVQKLVSHAASDVSGLSGLGFGRDLLQILVNLLCWSLLLVQPALMAGVLTYEKERHSFPLLVLTGMRPSKMLLEKYVSGLFPMVTLLFLAAPLGALTMGYGGVSPQLLASGGFVVLVTWLAVGAFSLLCSAWCRTTIGALLTAYFAGAALMILPSLTYSLTVRYVLWGTDLRGVDLPDWLWGHWPTEVFARLLQYQQSTASISSDKSFTSWIPIFKETTRLCSTLFIVTAVSLILARMFVFRRGDLLPTHSKRSTLRQPQPRRFWFARFAAGLTRGWRSLFPSVRDLPEYDPVAWRESGGSILGRRGTYLYTSTILAGIILALSIFLLGLYPKTAGPQRLHYLAIALGSIALLVLVVRSVASLLNEHTNQTLDILLSTPMDAPEIVKEKASALHRYAWLFGLLLSIVFGLQGWAEYEYVRPGMFWRQLGQYWGVCLLALVIYPTLIIWSSLLVAMWQRRRIRAIMTLLAVFSAWAVLPIFVLSAVRPDWRDYSGTLWLSLLSPLGIIDANEQNRIAQFTITTVQSTEVTTSFGQPWVPVASSFAAYAAVAAVARFLCLRLADRCLRK